MAGLAACQYFSKKGISVQVVDPKPFFEWLPNMHEIISGSKSEKLLQFDKRRYLKKTRARLYRSRCH